MTGKPCFLVVRTTKNRPKLLLVVREIVRPRRSCRSGRSPEACSRSAARSRSANCWVTTAHNGRRCSRRRCSRRVLSGQSDMTGCRPARVGSERTPWRSIGCIDPRGSPAGGAGSGSWRPCLQVTAKEPSQEAPGRKSQRPRSVFCMAAYSARNAFGGRAEFWACNLSEHPSRRCPTPGLRRGRGERLTVSAGK